MPEPTSDIVGKFDEALEYFRKRVPMPAGQFYALETQAREKAFTVSGTAQADVIQDVLDSIERALEEGQDLKSWKAEIRYALQHAWAGTVADPGWRLETIYRTNLQTAFSHGRVRQMREPEVVAVRPYWLYDATRDSRTTHECRELDGTLLPANDPRWKGRIPPRRFNCRSHLQTLRRSQAERRGGIKLPPDDIGPPENGFGEGPSDDPNVQVEPFKPVRKYDPTLAAIKERKDADKPKPPRAKPEHTPEHWVEEYRRKGYNEETARTLAIGRAAEERGLDRPFAESQRIAKRLAEAKFRLGAHLAEQIEWLEDEDLATLRDQLEIAVGADGHSGVRSLAALLEHAESVDRSPVPLKMRGRPRDNKKRQDEHSNAVRFYELFGHRSLVHPTDHRFNWGRSRGSYPLRVNFITGEVLHGGRIDLSDKPGVLVHEWGHALEHLNPAVGRRSRAFLRTRTASEPTQRLRDIHPDRNYGRNEITKPDRFFTAYVGKIYEHKGRLIATEVLSMGLERIAQGEGWKLHRDDPDLFWFCLGQLADPGT